MSLATEIAGKLNYLNGQDKNIVNAIAPYSGYMAWKENNFYFNISSSFLASIADTNRYIKFGNKVVDTYGKDKTDDNWIYTAGITGTSASSINETSIILEGKTFDGYYDAITLEAGVYKIKSNIVNPTNSEARIYISTSIGGGQLVDKRQTTDFDFELIIIATTNVFIECRLGNHTNKITFTKPSVREIQSKSATDYIPEVTVQDQATYGLTTQSSVNAGDYVVVDRKELVTNGTFDTDTGWIKQTGWTISGGVATCDGTNNTFIYQSQGMTAGLDYIVSIEVTSYISGMLRVGATGTYSPEYITSAGIHSRKITATSNGGIEIYSQDSFNGSIDNISVKQVDEVYRAKIDAPSGTLLTNTTYFEARDDKPISNQIAFLHTMDSTTKAYEGISNEILFNDALAVETPKAIMLKNGFSEVSKGLYSKGSKLYVFAGYWQTLNKGAYHPVWNMAGTACYGNTVFGTLGRSTWYDSAVLPNNTVSLAFLNKTLDSLGRDDGSILGTVDTIYPRPDNKYYDIIYQDQFISFESSELAYKPNSDEKKRIREYEKYRGVEGGVEFTQGNFNGAVSTTLIEISGYNTSLLAVDDEITMQSYNGSTTIKDYGTVNQIISSSTFHVTIPSGLGATWNSYIGYKVNVNKTLPFNSKGTSLTTDLIGNPTNYPTIMKDRLAEGKGVFGINPLLVSDIGVSLIPNGSVAFKLSKKVLSALNYSNSMDNGATYQWNGTYETNHINNSGGVPVFGEINYISYTSQNNPYQATNPKAVASVEPKVIASNSHSIHKGAIVGNCIGKIQVGNGTNGYESKVLENSEIYGKYEYDYKVSSYNYANVSTGTKWLSDKITTNGQYLSIYESVSAYRGNINMWVENFTNTSNWKLVYSALIPSHQPITLDNANSPASKWFEGICYDDDYEYPFVVMEELAYNTGTSSYDGDDEKFTQLTNGTITDLNNKTVVTKFMVGTPIGRRN